MSEGKSFTSGVQIIEPTKDEKGSQATKYLGFLDQYQKVD